MNPETPPSWYDGPFERGRFERSDYERVNIAWYSTERKWCYHTCSRCSHNVKMKQSCLVFETEDQVIEMLEWANRKYEVPPNENFLCDFCFKCRNGKNDCRHTLKVRDD